MAGVPRIFEAMLESVLPKLTGGSPVMSQSLQIMRPEGDIAGPLADLAARYPDLSMGSYPFQREGAFGAHVVLRGTDPERLDAAMAELRKAFPG